jgi:hypothetical protein
MGLSALSGNLHQRQPCHLGNLNRILDGSQARPDSNIGDKKHDQHQEGYPAHTPAVGIYPVWIWEIIIPGPQLRESTASYRSDSARCYS